MRNHQAGLTLIETVLVLLVAAVIIGGIWLAYSQVNLNNQVERTVKVLDETLAVTRDYLSAYSTVPPDLSQRLYNRATGVNLMPPELTYAYGAANTVVAKGVNADAQIFMSPLEAEFFVQYPNGIAVPTKIFEVRIRFLRSAGDNDNNVSQCLAIVNELVGTQQAISDRGLVGYWVGGAFAGTTPYGTTQMNTIDQLIPIKSQQNNCVHAIDIRLYFSMRP